MSEGATGRWLTWTLWSILGILVATASLTLITLQFGGVHGVELNPFSFARRSYSLYEIPLFRWQVRSVRRQDITSTTTDTTPGNNNSTVLPFRSAAAS